MKIYGREILVPFSIGIMTSSYQIATNKDRAEERAVEGKKAT